MSLKRAQTLNLGPQTWAVLSPLSGQPLKTYDLVEDTVSIGRNPQCSIQIIDKRLSGKHCSIVLKGETAFLLDLSTNGTFIGTVKVGKGKELPLKHHDEIWLLSVEKVPINETIGFRVNIVKQIKKKEEEDKLREEEDRKKQKENKVKEQEENKKKQEENKKKQEENKKKQSFVSSIKEQITCSFCTEIMCQPVTVQPCNHRFCGGCLTELVDNKKDTCIQCRKPITTANRDAAFNSIVQDYLKNNPGQRRDPKEEEQSKKKNIFGHDPINIQEKVHGVKKVVPAKPPPKRGGRRVVRTTSDLSASDDEGDKCRQCTVERGGFRCGPTQKHTKCHTCSKLIAQREDQPQHCALCTTYICNLYFPPCAKSGNKLQVLPNRRGSARIDSDLLRGNAYEFEVLRKYLSDKKWTSKEVFDHMMGKIERGKYAYLFDRKVMKVAPLVSKEVKLEKNSAVCDMCWRDLWFQMVLDYRIEINGEMPTAVRDRPTCYYGINCRTMDHKSDHARKYAHCIYQIRF